MMSERKEELINYINLLIKLKSNGFNCGREINKALSELNHIMFEKKPFNKEPVKIVVLDSDFAGVVYSAKLFENILYNAKVVSRDGDDLVVEGGNTIVHIYKVNDKTLASTDKFRGLCADYIINNTKISHTEIGISLKDR